MGKTQVGYFMCISSLTNATIKTTSTTTIVYVEYCNNYHIRVYKIHFTQNYDKPFQIICTGDTFVE